MKIKLSKSQWENMGKKTGWIKEAQKYQLITKTVDGREVWSIGYENSTEKVKNVPWYNSSESAKKALEKINQASLKINLNKTAQIIPDDGIADGREPYTDDEMDLMEKEDKRLSFSFGTTPEEIIKERVIKQTPNGYRMHIKSQQEWSAIAKAVNQGIDSHLEGFTRSKFDHTTGQCLIHPEEMTTFLRRLYEDGDDEAWGLRTSILETLGIEEI